MLLNAKLIALIATGIATAGAAVYLKKKFPNGTEAYDQACDECEKLKDCDAGTCPAEKCYGCLETAPCSKPTAVFMLPNAIIEKLRALTCDKCDLTTKVCCRCVWANLRPAAIRQYREDKWEEDDINFWGDQPEDEMYKAYADIDPVTDAQKRDEEDLVQLLEYLTSLVADADDYIAAFCKDDSAITDELNTIRNSIVKARADFVKRHQTLFMERDLLGDLDCADTKSKT